MATRADDIERVDVAPGVALRVLRRAPDGAAGGSAREAAGGAAAEGSNYDFLLVHGLASNARLWDGVAARLAEFGCGSVAVDLRGHGRSDKPDGGYDFETISSDLRALVEALGLRRPVLVGQSWGAGVVLDFAVRYPKLSRGIVLVDGGLNDLRDGFPDWDACWSRLEPPQLVGLPLSDVEAYFRINHSDWPPEGIEGSLANFEIRPDRTIAPWLTRERHRAILKAMWDQRVGEMWQKLRVPALIVPVDGGEGDWVAAKRAGAVKAQAALESSGVPVRARWFMGDHDVHAQQPLELADEMLAAEQAGLFGEVGAR